MNTTTVPLERHVRSRDPETSWDAATIDADKWTALLANVYAIVRDIGPATHDEIAAEYEQRGHPRVTPQRIRTACHDLVIGGARDFGRTRQFDPAIRRSEQTGKTAFGRRTQKWEAIAR